MRRRPSARTAVDQPERGRWRPPDLDRPPAPCRPGQLDNTLVSSSARCDAGEAFARERRRKATASRRLQGGTHAEGCLEGGTTWAARVEGRALGEGGERTSVGRRSKERKVKGCLGCPGKNLGSLEKVRTTSVERQEGGSFLSQRQVERRGPLSSGGAEAAGPLSMAGHPEPAFVPLLQDHERSPLPASIEDSRRASEVSEKGRKGRAGRKKEAVVWTGPRAEGRFRLVSPRARPFFPPSPARQARPEAARAAATAATDDRARPAAPPTDSFRALMAQTMKQQQLISVPRQNKIFSSLFLYPARARHLTCSRGSKSNPKCESSADKQAEPDAALREAKPDSRLGGRCAAG